MATATTARIAQPVSQPGTRYDRKLAEILDHAAQVFAEKGYEGASMRDLARVSGVSLAGLYYYFDSKEKLLYWIQKHTFETILGRLREGLQGSSDPEERIRIFVRNHVEYAVARPNAMKVLSHEDDVLKNGLGRELAGIKREYYRIALGLLDELLLGAQAAGRKPPAKSPGGSSSRIAVMGLFGIINWINTWYNPQVDPDAETLAAEMSRIFLDGVARDATVPERQNDSGQKTDSAAGKPLRRGSIRRTEKVIQEDQAG